jgi:hypothetical protein
MFDIGDPNALVARANLRFTRAEHDRLKDEADMAGMSLSEFIRSHMLGKRVASNTDMQTIRELRRIGGLLKHLHNESAGDIKIASAMGELEAALRALAK